MDGIVEIPILRRDGSLVAVALVDEHMAYLVEGHTWRLMDIKRSDTMYAQRGEKKNGVREVFLMHRVLMGVHGVHGIEVDHINRNGLDNRLENLRLATHAENMQNRKKHSHSGREPYSQFRGVKFDPTPTARKPWKARARLDGKRYHIGAYHTENEAAVAVAEWRMKHMPFAVENKVAVTGVNPDGR